MNKKKMIAAAVAALGIATVVGVGSVSAATGETGLANKIATKFNLNPSEVQQVIDQDHQDRHAQMEKRYEAKLQAAVSAGKLTNEQKDKLIAKHDEMEANRKADREKFQNMTEAERQAVMESRRTELEQWAKDNNIPVEYVMPGPGGRGGHGPGMGMGMGHRMMDSDDAPATQ